MGFIKKKKRKEYVWWRKGRVWGKGLPLWAHAEASLPPEVPAIQPYRGTSHTAVEYRIVYSGHGEGS